MCRSSTGPWRQARAHALPEYHTEVQQPLHVQYNVSGSYRSFLPRGCHMRSDSSFRHPSMRIRGRFWERLVQLCMDSSSTNSLSHPLQLLLGCRWHRRMMITRLPCSSHYFRTDGVLSRLSKALPPGHFTTDEPKFCEQLEGRRKASQAIRRQSASTTNRNQSCPHPATDIAKMQRASSIHRDLRQTYPWCSVIFTAHL